MKKTKAKTKTKIFIGIITAILIISMLLISPVRAANLTGVSVTAGDYTAGATTTYTITFTTATEIPSDGTIDITFPEGYDLSAVETGDVTVDPANFGTSGTLTCTAVDPTARKVTITVGNEALPVSTTVTVTIADVKNPITVGGYTINIATSALDTGSASVTIDPAALHHCTIEVDKTIVTKDGTVTVTLRAYDQYGNEKDPYTPSSGSITWDCTDELATITIGAEEKSFPQTEDGTTLTFPVSHTVKLNSFGSHTISVSGTLDTVEISLVTDPIYVTSRLGGFTITAPSIVSKGDPFEVTIKALDEHGYVKIDYNGEATLTSTDPLAEVDGKPLPTTITFTDGVWSSSNVKLNTFGAQTITVTRDSKTATSDPIGVGVVYGDSLTVNVGDELYFGADADVEKGITPGGKLLVYWDEVHDWDAATGTGLLAETYAKTDKSFKVLITIPKAAQGPHDLIVKDYESSVVFTTLTTVTVDPKIVLDPTAGIVGDTITITGTGFAADSTISFTAEPTITTSPSTVKTDDLGSFICTFKIPEGAPTTYTITATDEAGNSASADLKVGTCITLTPDEGLPGTEVTILGRAFTPGKTVDIQWAFPGGGYLTLVDDYPIDSTGTFTTTFTVPLVETGEYTVKAIDSAGAQAEATFTVKGVTKITLNPDTGLVGDTFTVVGEWFTPSSTVSIYFDGTLLATGVPTNLEGGFSQSVVVPDVAVGSYTVKAIDAEGVYATATFTVSPKLTVIKTLSDEYLQGDIISFYINSTVAFKTSSTITIKIIDPSGYPLDTLSVSVPATGTTKIIPYADVSVQLPSDAPLGVWNWTATYTLTGQTEETEVSGNFTVVERPTLATVLERLDAVNASLSGLIMDAEGGLKAYIDTSLGPVVASLEDINATLVSVQNGVATINTTVGELKVSVDALDLAAINAAITSLNGSIVEISTDLGTVQTSLEDINAKVVSIDNGVVTISTDLGTVSAHIDEVKDSLSDVQDAVDGTKTSVDGLMTAVYGAIILSLIAALASIIAVITLQRKIAG